MKDTARHLTSEINVTPFLDVLLVLLITFMAAMTARKALDTHLPVPCTGSCGADGGAIMLEVLADGTFRLNGQPLSAGELSATLHATFDARPRKIMAVAGHRDATYQRVLAAMDVARSAGVTVISIPPSESYADK